MDIKLNARLSAYSKIEGVGCIVESVTYDQIEQLFDGNNFIVPEGNLSAEGSVTHDDIDSLFN